MISIYDLSVKKSNDNLIFNFGKNIEIVFFDSKNTKPIYNVNAFFYPELEEGVKSVGAIALSSYIDVDITAREATIRTISNILSLLEFDLSSDIIQNTCNWMYQIIETNLLE